MRNIENLAIAVAFGGQGHPAIARGPRLLAEAERAAERSSLLGAMKEPPVDFVGQGGRCGCPIRRPGATVG